jgi:hypothetical protein
MTMHHRWLIGAALGAVLAAGLPVRADAGAATQAVRREIVRRAELVAAERAALLAAEQQAARQTAVRAAQQQAARQAALRAALARDARRDAVTKAIPLNAERRVFRYTSKAQAAREVRSGVAAGSHMTARAGAGRPPLATTAQRQYGLPKAPQVRMSILLKPGMPVRHNKALAGEAGRGELTAPVVIRKEAIEKVVPLH